MKPPSTGEQPAPSANDGRSRPRFQVPKIEAPKGGGAIRSLGENFEVDPSTGTASLRVPIPLPSTAREIPLDLSLSYDSGRGNGPFGLGWQLDLPSISRKTDRGIPRYGDDDVFLLSGAEELVPRVHEGAVDCLQVGDFDVCRFRPRVESASERIEHWTERDTGLSHWRVTNSQNVTSVYGRDAEARIVDPERPDRIFSWLLQEIRNDRGEIIRFGYKQEDSAGLSPFARSEAHRLRQVGTTSLLRANAQRYIKRVQFGNSAPFSATGFHFELVFDYGEHEDTPDETRPWSLRPDPFSTYRSAFEIRTYRRCARILLFHRFPELGPAPVLTRSHELSYNEDRHISKLRSVVQHGYRTDAANGTVKSASHPAIEFDYTPLEFDTQIRYLDRQSLLGVPAGVEGKQNQWVDLDGEGVPGILTAHRDSWSYKANLGGGRFSEPQPLVTLPSPRNLGRGPQALQDLDGNGQLALVQYEPPLQGFFPRTPAEDWGPLQPFPAVPRLNWASPHLRFVDVDGDGLTDVLMSSDRGFDWVRGKGKDGFEPGGFTPYPNSEAEGPQVVFADSSHSIHLADMSGDGLQDIVRVQNGEVCYWPNLGYGRFGPKVSMERCPVFASLRDFDPRRVRLADIDGSGTADIIYLGKVNTIYRNEAGNGWSEGIPIPGLQTKTVLSEVAVVDLLGTGTSCIVHSSISPADRFHPVSYVDLLGGKKPHLLQGIRNNLGGETRLEYAPSTKFYLEDAAAGQPWLTRLHFPVQVVEKTEHHDHVTGARLVTRYRYRHGYYDGPEREFRGFALVDKWDAESFRSGPDGSALDLPPVRSRTWFHTGASLHGTPLEEGLAAEFHGGTTAPPPPRSLMPPTNSLEEAREAARALRGKVLREELYAEDGSAKEGEPYLITEHRYQVKRLQEKGAMRHGVFLPHPLETFETHTEREQDNPRKKQQLFLEVDEFGNVLLEAEVAFARGGGADATQGQTLTRVMKRTFTHRVDEIDWYRHSVPIRDTVFELMKWEPTEERLDPEDFAGFIRSLGHGVPFHDDDPEGPTRLREVEDTLTLYTDDQQSSPLPEGELESLALPFDTYRKVFTPELLERTFRDRVDADILVAEGGYTDPLGDGDYWAPTGRIVFDATKFFLPQQFIDPFGGTTHVVHDAAGLLLEETTDPVGNVTVVDNDYQALQPRRIVDPNENRTLLAYDPLGLLMQLARHGKGEGDDLSDPTLSFHYDLHAWSRDGTPAWSRTESKEAYGPGNTRHQIAWTYTSGLGQEVMQKVQAQPGEALLRGPDGRLVLGHVQERWIGTGRTVLDNKGNVVKQYEPYFSSTPAYEDEDDLVEWGVTPIFHYDPLGRLIRTELPNGTERRVEFDAWSQTEWDENDAIEGTDWLHERLLLDPTDPEYRAAMLALEHANTPTVTHFDPLGRPYLQVEDNGPAGLYETRTELDIGGNPRRVIDARGVAAEERAFDMLGRPLRLLSPDSGETWTLPNCVDAPLRRWDGRGFAVRWSYDLAQRQTHVYVQKPKDDWTLVEYALFGEHHPQAADENLRGQIHLHFDGAGLLQNVRFDLDGNLRDSIRQLALDPTTPPDWMLLQGTTDPAHALEEAFPLLEGETFVVRSMYDALGRLVSQHQPDGSEMRYSYHESSLLQRLEAQVPGAPGWTEIVADTEYNAKGQRTRARFGQGVLTSYTYDKQTFRILRMFSARPADKVTLQDLQFTYDPVGNIVEQRDEAQEDVYFGNTVVCAKGLYEYDALYRLVEAKGREHPGQQPGDSDLPWSSLPHPNVTNALIRYTERYLYDEVGNILQMQHLAGAGGWTRRYQYETRSGGAPASNRLLATSLPGDPTGGPYSAHYTYDASGNMTSMPHLQGMDWDWASRLQHVSKGGGGDVYFSYAPDGQRVRKVYQHGNVTDERIYLGAYELFRRRTSGTLETERHTLHLQDGDKRLAMAETLTVDQGKEIQAPAARLRFQLPNHLDSVCVETDEHGAVITYEEYHPYGTTALRAEAPGAAVSAKRYRYTGMERDEETSLAYHTARYYAPWLARWTSPDPLGMVDGVNRFRALNSSPTINIDPSGKNSQSPTASTLDPNDPLNYPSPESYIQGIGISLHPDELRRRWEVAHSSNSPKSIQFDPADIDTATVISILAAHPAFQESLEELDNQPNPIRIHNVDSVVASMEHSEADKLYSFTANYFGEVASHGTDGTYDLLYSPSILEAGYSIFGTTNEDIQTSFMLERDSLLAITHGLAGHILGATRDLPIQREDNFEFTAEQENLLRAQDQQLESHDFPRSQKQLEAFRQQVIKNFNRIRNLNESK